MSRSMNAVTALAVKGGDIPRLLQNWIHLFMRDRVDALVLAAYGLDIPRYGKPNISRGFLERVLMLLGILVDNVERTRIAVSLPDFL